MLRLALLACLTALPAHAVTMTFDTDTNGETYTEAGMTIARIRNADIPVYMAGGLWGLDISSLFDDPTPTGAFHLSTGRPFKLQSIFVAHMDRQDPVTFRGFRGGVQVAFARLTQPTLFPDLYGEEVPYTYVFNGFGAVDYLTVTSGPNRFSDMRFDDLTFAPVPVPAALPLLAAALGLLAIRGRPSRGSSSTRPRSPAGPTSASC